jgi:hypothetical protein
MLPQAEPICLATGVTIEFKRDASKIIEAAVNDNGTVIVLKKK